MMATAVELLFVRPRMEEQEQTLRNTPTLYTDSSSVLAPCGRRGLGRVKHLDIRTLALQIWNMENRASWAKLPSAENRADILTKPMTCDILQHHAKAKDHVSDKEPQSETAWSEEVCQ